MGPPNLLLAPVVVLPRYAPARATAEFYFSRWMGVFNRCTNRNVVCIKLINLLFGGIKAELVRPWCLRAHPHPSADSGWKSLAYNIRVDSVFHCSL